VHDARRHRLVVALVVLGATTLLVANHLGPFPGEVGIVEAVNRLPRVIGAPLEVVMQLGTLGAALLVVGGVVGLTAPRVGPGITVLVAALLGHQIDDVLKEIVERPRPGAVLPDLVPREVAEGFAFPSGHTTIAFALATAVAALLPARWRAVPFGLATGVAVARMYVGVHWPTDLVGGAALGIALGTAAWMATDEVTRRMRADPS
jgi:membrane-associated phospholipid phosphatase